jgi:hypothetical protein
LAAVADNYDAIGSNDNNAIGIGSGKTLGSENNNQQTTGVRVTMVMAVTMQEERDGGGNCISAGVSGGDAIAPSGPKSMCFLCGKFSSAARINAFINGMPSNTKINKKQCHFIRISITTETEPSITTFLTKRPHPAAIFAQYRSNKCLCKPD